VPLRVEVSRFVRFVPDKAATLCRLPDGLKALAFLDCVGVMAARR